LSVRVHKKWVVVLTDIRRKSKRRDRLIICAKTKEAAIAGGKRHSQIFSNPKQCSGTAGLADPIHDLGGEINTTGKSMLILENLNEKGRELFMAGEI